MIGAIAGDIVGSVYEARPVKSREFPIFSRYSTFTDDSVLSVGVADAILNARSYVDTFHDYFRRYPGAGYGAHFAQWAGARMRDPYGSYGNGSAMRVSPVGWAKDSLHEVLEEARASASVTHDHPEGIKGAMAVAASIFLARQNHDKVQIAKYVQAEFGYRLDRRLDDIRPGYAFDVSCQGSVPESIICFLESEDFEGCLRNAVSLGGDADTMACIAGGIAEAYFGGIPEHFESEVRRRLDPALMDTVDRFRKQFCLYGPP